MDYSEELIKTSAAKLGIDLSKYDMEQIKMGMAVELEHGSKSGEKLNVTGDDPMLTLKIALAHLEEDPQYYTKLAKIEERYKLKSYDTHDSADITEDVGGAFATLDSTPGMGAPVLASRGVIGSGDVPSLPAKKERKKIKSFSQFIKK